MKLVLTVLVVLCSVNFYGQNRLKDIIKLPWPIEVPVDSIATNNITKSLEKITTHNIIDECWDHTTYNPYKDVDIQFPIQITFEDSTYCSPIGKHKVVTSRYGWRRGRAHQGIDIDLVTGDSVYAMFDGVVRMSRYTKGHGRTVVLRHYNNLETVYAHLSEYGVKENDTVKKGDFLGKGGVSGNARGSHLHLVVNYKGVSINPEYFFKFNNENKIRAKELWVTRRWTQPMFHNSRKQSIIKPLLTKDEALASLIKQRSIYIVKPGDTLSRISKNNNVSIAAICKVNAIRKTTVIKVGQKLFIEK
ncbi:peptidoglycan DD-metalloendopeptidase family protein [Seonamhaeicola algicola]|uniref:Peptidoglycan DD-metalloendopeptidase family protein n=1 Tax=Seonamhaeicola algicola TaxID=1719036 RepID=A0A5C7AYJ3_9FLAO|nr:M23 family metallopeptidase [Seonamhaeicola algicola]TXE11565.1 peptidoglycan DD-metalloendopeptidase family protein [Seonamhaeicola algicola]